MGAQASSAVDDLKGKATDLLATAKGAASDAGTKVTDALEGQKAAGTERVKSISDALRRAAGELEHDIPPAATYIKRAADEIDHMADAVKRRDVRQIVGDVQDFAKRQPAAFLGAAVLGGFALVRLLKTPTTSHESASYEPAGSASGRALMPVGSLQGGRTTTGGAGDPGGISPQAPGFDVKAGPSTGARHG